MGLIKAAMGAAGGAMADQWKEFFYCDSLDADTLVVKGSKRTSKRSSNTKGNENVITSDSVIAVADGQCMLIVEQGKVVEVCAEPGEFIYDASASPLMRSENASRLAERWQAISAFTISIQKKSSATNSVHRIRCRSAW